MKTREYKIVYEPYTLGSTTYPKYYVYYYEDGINISREFLGTSENNFLPLRNDFVKKLDTSNITEYKQYLRDKLDEKTREVITQGFVYDGITFSLSENAQTNITNLPNVKDEKFPMPYLGKDDEYYVLTLAKKMDFYYKAFDTIADIKIANGVIKTQVLACTTTEELDSIRLENNID